MEDPDRTSQGNTRGRLERNRCECGKRHELAEHIFDKRGRTAVVWPANSDWWDLPEVPAFEHKARLPYVLFSGAHVRKQQPVNKTWAIPRCDEELVQIFLQFQCDKSHTHEPGEGSQTDKTGFYTLQFA